MCKNRGIYGFLGPSWVLITLAPRKIVAGVTYLAYDHSGRHLLGPSEVPQGFTIFGTQICSSDRNTRRADHDLLL